MRVFKQLSCNSMTALVKLLDLDIVQKKKLPPKLI